MIKFPPRLQSHIFARLGLTPETREGYVSDAVKGLSALVCGRKFERPWRMDDRAIRNALWNIRNNRDREGGRIYGRRQTLYAIMNGFVPISELTRSKLCWLLINIDEGRLAFRRKGLQWEQQMENEKFVRLPPCGPWEL
jgi:hypothetical protein